MVYKEQTALRTANDRIQGTNGCKEMPTIVYKAQTAAKKGPTIVYKAQTACKNAQTIVYKS